MKESDEIEFKLSFNDDVIISLVAFANAKGGSVLVGMDDNGTNVGVALGKETLVKWLNEIKNKTAPTIIPDVEEKIIDNKVVVEFSIGEYLGRFL